MKKRQFPRLQTDVHVNVYLSEATRGQWQLKDRSEEGFYIETNAHTHSMLDIGIVAMVSIEDPETKGIEAFVTEVVRMTDQGVGCRIIGSI